MFTSSNIEGKVSGRCQRMTSKKPVLWRVFPVEEWRWHQQFPHEFLLCSLGLDMKRCVFALYDYLIFFASYCTYSTYCIHTGCTAGAGRYSQDTGREDIRWPLRLLICRRVNGWLLWFQLSGWQITPLLVPPTRGRGGGERGERGGRRRENQAWNWMKMKRDQRMNGEGEKQ